MLNSVHITYDGEGDTLYVSFGDSRGATGYQISDQVLLRMDPDSDEPTGLTIFNFLHHIRSGLKQESSLMKMKLKGMRWRYYHLRQ